MYSTKKVCIRVDANEIIATGHEKRCLAIAAQLLRLGIEVIFLVADDKSAELLVHEGYKVKILNSNWEKMDDELPMLCSFLRENYIKVLLIDSYYVTEKYLKCVSNWTKIIYIDDLNKFCYPVNTVISYSIWVKETDYICREYIETGYNTKFLLGGEYAPLREEFQYQKYNVRDNVKNVLITMGGTDRLNVIGNILEMVLHDAFLKNYNYHIIVGCFNQHKEQLYVYQKKESNVYIHENIDNISYWMRSCDIAISAGGTTLYELCACGIPTIGLKIADNQKGILKWVEHGYMLYGGDAEKDMDRCMQMCAENMHKFIENQGLRIQISGNMQKLLDGCGASRIAQYIEKLL